MSQRSMEGDELREGWCVFVCVRGERILWDLIGHGREIISVSEQRETILRFSTF